MNANTSVALVPIDRSFTEVEGLALAGFLAGYRGSTREAYALDLRQFGVWCANHEHRLFEVHRVEIECFGRDPEARGRARATIARRLCTIAGVYRYVEEEGLIAHSPAIHVRRPRLDYESHATGLDRNELGALLVAAPEDDHNGTSFWFIVTDAGAKLISASATFSRPGRTVGSWCRTAPPAGKSHRRRRHRRRRRRRRHQSRQRLRPR
jgi:hypothetical protein